MTDLAIPIDRCDPERDGPVLRASFEEISQISKMIAIMTVCRREKSEGARTFATVWQVDSRSVLRVI